MSLIQNSSIFDGVNLNNSLQKANQSMAGTVSGLDKQTINPFKSIASSVQEGVATINEKETAILNNLSSYRSAIVEGINNGLENLTGGLFNLSNFGSIIKYEDGFKIDTDELLSIGSKGLGFNINSMQDLKQQIGDGFLEELNKVTFGLADGLFMVDAEGNGIKLHLANDWKYNMGTTLIDFLGKDDPEGFGSIVNIAGMNAILNKMMDESIRNGLWQGYGRFSDMYTFQSDYHDALINGIDIALGKGDVESLNTIIDIIQKEGVAKVHAKYPDLVERMLANFTLNRDVTPGEYPLVAAKLLKVFTVIAGPDWYKYPTQFGMALNLGLVSSISDHAKMILVDTDELGPLLCASGVFVEQSALEKFKSDFSNAIVFQ